jgi:hypothetical protein
MRRGFLLLALWGGLAGGCGEALGPATPAPRGRVHHLVFVSLKAPSEADALARDMETTLAGIPGLLRIHVGRPLDLGRPEVTADYDVGATMEFATVEALRGYPDHPLHRALLERWTPKVARLRVHDVEDRTP